MLHHTINSFVAVANMMITRVVIDAEKMEDTPLGSVVSSPPSPDSISIVGDTDGPLSVGLGSTDA